LRGDERKRDSLEWWEKEAADGEVGNLLDSGV